MYDELVKRLRNRRICIQQSGGLEDFPLLKEAADTIEELICEVADERNSRLDAEDKLRWIPVTEDTPSDFVSVQAHMTDSGPFPSVREAYTVDGLWFFPALKEFHPVDMWKRFDDPLKEE